MRPYRINRNFILIAAGLALIGGCGNPQPKPNFLLAIADDRSRPHATIAGDIFDLYPYDGGSRPKQLEDTVIYIAQGVMTGEITSHSVIMQTRLTAAQEPVNGDVPGKKGIARMALDRDSTFQHPRFTDWKVSDSVSDYILRWSADTLQPHTRYFYRLEYGTHRNFTRQGKTGSFTTLPGPESDESVSFVVVTGMNYAKFRYGPNGTPEKSSAGAATGMDQSLGFPALETITAMAPTFLVGTGDNVYYDDPGGRWTATTIGGMRKKWHEQFAQPRFIHMFLKVPTLWEKDDHDHRYNDCDTTGDIEPANTAGKRIFLEQMPVTMDIRNENSTFRTIRVNRHLQIWLTEGRDHRSPNALPDGPEKTLWGAKQAEWLKHSLLNSDASYRILISPTPMVGPDDAYKSDNHTNPKGFRNEGEAFFKWLEENHIPRDRFFIVCGDRHWQYHARHPSGYEEFSTGALVDANSRAGRLAGDPNSTDPDSLIHQYFVQGPGQASGGFLNIRQRTDQGVIKLIFTFHDEHGKVHYSVTRETVAPQWVRFAFPNTAIPVLFNSAGLPASCFAPQSIEAAPTVHMVSDLAHEFTFYADHRFDAQYLPGQKAVTNWCDLWHFDFSNANLLVLLGCDNRIGYTGRDIETIDSFLKSGGGVVVFGSEKSTSQNALLKHFGAEFSGQAIPPLSASEKIVPVAIEGTGGSVLSFESAGKWEILVSDASQKAMMARKRVGKGTLLIASRSLSGSHPSARDSINKEIWKPLLIETASGKVIDPNKPFRELGIEDLEYNDNHGTFKLSYNDYMKPFAEAMVDVYKRSMPFVEKRMGVPLSPGMASQVTLLATGGGGFSSGTVVALAVWWGGFPDKEDSMIEFLTHESVHSWVLPFAEVWNEPIATYVGNLVMMDMGHEEEALRRIQRTIERAEKLDPTMKNYDLKGNLTGTGPELSDSEKNDIHWGKSYWVLEQLRKENPDIIARYFKLKRELAMPGRITTYDINNTVALLSKAMGRDLFAWFNEYGIPVNRNKAEIQ